MFQTARAAVLFTEPDMRVEELFGQDQVVALHFPVVAWGVGRDPLMRAPRRTVAKSFAR
jgi:hypothetical protein